MRHSFLTFVFSFGLAKGQAEWIIGNAVKTTSGTVIGQASKWQPQVSEYLGIPFAKAPEGDLRWAPPQSISDSSKVINATKYVRFVNGSCHVLITNV
jgi:cholinesterase